MADTAALVRLPIDHIDAGPNTRGDLDDLTELATSLRHLGQQIPVIVEPVDGRYRLLDGHRRHAAARRAGLTHLDAVVRPAAVDGPARIVRQLAMQAGGRAFNPIAEARALHELMFGHNMTREHIAALVGRSPKWVKDRIALTHLTPDEKTAVERGRMPVGEALLILAGRRAQRDGRPPDAWRARPATPPPTPAETPHLGQGHPLAAAATRQCAGRDHLDRLQVGGVACGECWEQVIRADERIRAAT